MNIKKLTILFLIISSTVTFAQKSATIEVTHFPGNTLVNGQSKFVAPNYIRVSTTNLNCFSFLDVAVYVKASGDKDKPYRYKIEFRNNSQFETNVTWRWSFEGSGNRHDLASNGGSYESTSIITDNKGPSIKISNVDFSFTTNEQQKYGVSTLSEKLDCNETPYSYLEKIKAKNKKKEKIKNLQDQIRSLGNSEAELINKLTLLKDLKTIDTKGNYDSRISSVEKKLQSIKDERNRKNKEISSLKQQINSLSNNKEDLEEKKQLFKKLDAIDEENNYDDKISKIEEEIETIKKEEKEEQNKEYKKEENKEETEETEETEEEKEERLKEEADEKERDKAKEKQEAEERERKRKEEAERVRKEKIKAYNDRIENQRKENNAIAAAAATSSASALYLIGGVIYNRMGLPGKDFYTGNNFHLNFDIGYGLSIFPIAHNSVKTGVDFNGDETTGSANNDPSSTLTIDLRLALKLGYEMEYGGGNIFGRFEPGFSPIFTDFNSSYGYGIEVFGGHENIKLYGRYESGSHNFSTKNWIDPEEVGEGGKSSTKYQQIRTGLKFSFYKNERTAKRDHIIIGVMENYFNEDAAPIFSIRELPNKPILNLLKTPSTADLNPYIATGYFFEWKRDHTHRLYIEFFPNYPVTGKIGGGSNEGKFFLQAGFTRSIESFFRKK